MLSGQHTRRFNNFIPFMANYNRFLAKPEEYKPTQQPLRPHERPLLNLPNPYLSWANSNLGKLQNAFQVTRPRYQPSQPQFKNKYVCLKERGDNREPSVSVKQYNNKLTEVQNQFPERNKSPIRTVPRELISNKGRALTPHNANISGESKDLPVTQRAQETPKLFKRRSITGGPGQERGYFNSNINPKQKRAKYFPTQQAYSSQPYYVSDLVANISNKPSPIYDHFSTIFKIIKSNHRKYAPSAEVKQLNLLQDVAHRNRKTIVFDMDQTLIHCTKTPLPPYDVKLTVFQPDRAPTDTGFNIRPHVGQVLENLSKHFEIIVFTASHSYYANTILDYIDPQRKFIHHRLFRQSCQEVQPGVFVKDLRVIPRSLANIVLVDNSSMSYLFQPDNGIPIVSYFEGKTDNELKKLQGYLMRLRHVSDVRNLNRKAFRTSEYVRFNHVDEAIKELFQNPK